MKAKYQKPSVEETIAEPTPLMVESLPENVEDGFNPDNTPKTGDTSGNLSRRNIWEADDEY